MYLWFYTGCVNREHSQMSGVCLMYHLVNYALQACIVIVMVYPVQQEIVRLVITVFLEPLFLTP